MGQHQTHWLDTQSNLGRCHNIVEKEGRCYNLGICFSFCWVKARWCGKGAEAYLKGHGWSQGLYSWGQNLGIMMWRCVCPLSIFLTSVTSGFPLLSRNISTHNRCTVLSIRYEKCVSVAYQTAPRVTAILTAKQGGRVEGAITKMNQKRKEEIYLDGTLAVSGHIHTLIF